MIDLMISDLGWINGSEDDPSDLCAHGRVLFRVNNTTFIRPEDGAWTVTTVALYLLRTLTSDHTPTNSVAEYNFLFPDCGFSVWPNEGKYKIICMGCNLGIDIQVTHHSATVELYSSAGTEIVSSTEWQSAVFGFTDQVLMFYQRCRPKRIGGDEFQNRGWRLFWSEWEERTGISVNQYLRHQTENIIRIQRLDLMAATVPHLEAELDNPAKLGELLKANVPSIWPPGEYDQEAIEFFRDRLKENPNAVGWYSWYAVLRAIREKPATLIGAGGFFGPPTAEGTVEIGFSVVPEFRLYGYATEMVVGLIDRAFSTPGISRILAHTRPSNHASIRVLERCGFKPTGPGREPGTIQYTMTQ